MEIHMVGMEGSMTEIHKDEEHEERHGVCHRAGRSIGTKPTSRTWSPSSPLQTSNAPSTTTA
eukprot:10516538-Prorocentrum_lima.AAC.1